MPKSRVTDALGPEHRAHKKFSSILESEAKNKLLSQRKYYNI